LDFTLGGITNFPFTEMICCTFEGVVIHTTCKNWYKKFYEGNFKIL